ncbi:MAG: hypothetical protein KC418_20075 [Anaerolineales bacterium]|nr:hypothetical protein [Anaerolineales bacterium]
MKLNLRTGLNRIKKPMFLAAILLLLSLSIFWWGPLRVASSAQAHAVFLPTSVKSGPAGLCRFSVNFLGDEDEFDPRPLRLGWYIDYQADTQPLRPHGLEYAPIIDLRQTGPNATDYVYSPNGQDLLDTIAGNPGAHWLIGNEPDRRYFQNDMEPHVYAHAYHELYYLIKSEDAAARIIAGNIVQPTDLRIQYLDMILASYQDQFGEPLPADGWGAHNFILNEASCVFYPDNCWGADIPPGIDAPAGELLGIDDNDDIDRFIARVERMRQWMYDNGYQNTVLFIDEYGVLMPEDLGFPPDRVNAFMTATFDYLLSAADPATGNPNDGHRLVQRLSWYSSSDDPFNFNGRIWNPNTGALTPVGQNYVNYVAPLSGVIDYYPVSITATPVALSPNQPTALTARIANQGNLLPTGNLVVQFYNGNPNNGAPQIGGDVSLSAPAGCGETTTAAVTWNNPTPGAHTIYVRVSAAGGVVESNTGNNVYSQSVVVP